MHCDAIYFKPRAFFEHIPSIFDERFEPTDERVLRGRRNALIHAGRWLQGNPITLDELVAFVVVQKMLCTADNTDITERQEGAMKEFCKFIKKKTYLWQVYFRSLQLYKRFIAFEGSPADSSKFFRGGERLLAEEFLSS